MGARTKRGYSRPRRGFGVQSNKGGLTAQFIPTLFARATANSFTLIVSNTTGQSINTTTLASTGTIDVWDSETGLIRAWDVEINPTGDDIEIVSVTAVPDGTVVIIQPWALYLKGANGEWFSALSFIAPT